MERLRTIRMAQPLAHLPQPQPRSSLVIGYGNMLRCDDAIGQQIAQAVASWRSPSIRAIAVHQLTPELAESLATCDLAIFVDACSITDFQTIHVKPLTPSQFSPIIGHISDPQSLLALTLALYQRIPQAWWVMVPGVTFDVGDRLSAIAKQNLKLALQTIYPLLNMRTELCMKLE